MKSRSASPSEYTKDRLFSYALWYTGKYRVSRAKLLENLTSKSKNAGEIALVMEQLNPYHSDIIEIRSVVESCLARAKPIQYVKNSLRQKKFENSDVMTVVSEYEAFYLYENFSSTIEKRIKSLIEKGSGPRGIEVDLVQKYPQFSKEIHIRCQDIDENELLLEIFRTKKFQISGKNLKTPELKKIQDTLVRKGFSFSAIWKSIGNMQDED